MKLSSQQAESVIRLLENRIHSFNIPEWEKERKNFLRKHSNVRREGIIPPSYSWTAEHWLAGLKVGKKGQDSIGLHGLVAKHLLSKNLSEFSEVDRIKALKTADIYAAVDDAVEDLKQLLVEAIDKLKYKSNYDSNPDLQFHSKFVAEDAFELDFGGIDMFHEGLGYMVGSPHPDLYNHMEMEHADDTFFETYNHNTGVQKQHTARAEWDYVVHKPASENGEHEMGRDGWTIDDFMARNGRGCVIVACAGSPHDGHTAVLKHKELEELQPELDYEVIMHMSKGDAGTSVSFKGCCLHWHDIVYRAGLSYLEVIAARLYTGPMFRCYNTCLRQQKRHWNVASEHEHRPINVPFSTTIHVINSMITKCSRVQPACRVFRGLAGGLLPQCFWQPDSHAIRGGVELAFMSTTRDRDVAMTFAKKAPQKSRGIVLQMHMGMVDRGASLSWVSQYPKEEEILFPPLTGLEVVGMPTVEDSVVVVDIRISVNPNAMTIEEVLAKMKRTHEELTKICLMDLIAMQFPDDCLRPLNQHHAQFIEAKDFSWYNRAENYKLATEHVLHAKLECAANVLRDDDVSRDVKKSAAATLLTPGDSVAIQVGLSTILGDSSGRLLQAHRMQVARLSGLTRLELRGRGFTCELPVEVMNLLGSAEFFDLSGNNFSNVPQNTLLALMVYDMTNWKDRKELIATGTVFNKAEQSDDPLHVKDCCLPAVIKHLCSLTELDLSQNRLHHVDEHIGFCDKLTCLNLSRNKLEHLPDTIGSLTQLRKLDVSENGSSISCVGVQTKAAGLCELPETILQLRALAELNLGGNRRLGDSAASLICSGATFRGNGSSCHITANGGHGLTQLVELQLWDTGLTEIPETIGDLSQLRLLNCKNCLLEALPPTLGRLTNLQKLLISNNNLASLPDAIGQCTALLDLRCQRNQIRALPDSIGELRLLQKIDCDGCQLQALPQTIGSCASLTTLDCRTNELSDLPSSICSLTALTTLNCRDNHISQLPADIGHCTSLKKLVISGNPSLSLERFPHSITALVQLRKWECAGCAVGVSKEKATAAVDLFKTALPECAIHWGRVHT